MAEDLDQPVLAGVLWLPPCARDDAMDVLATAVQEQGPGLLTPPGPIMLVRLGVDYDWLRQVRDSWLADGWLVRASALGGALFTSRPGWVFREPEVLPDLAGIYRAYGWESNGRGMFLFPAGG